MLSYTVCFAWLRIVGKGWRRRFRAGRVVVSGMFLGFSCFVRGWVLVAVLVCLFRFVLGFLDFNGY